jgi:hypothetical protein
MPAVSAVKKPRVSLDIQSGRLGGPITYFLYGVEGIGKSTFAADSPAPIFIDVERGTRELNVARLVEPEGGWTWLDVLDSIRLLETETHSYKTLAIDTVDELEALLWAYICERDKKSGIEDYGFGKGYQVALDEWRVFVAALERLRARRGMNVALIAHTVVRTFKNPEGEDYDRYQPRIHDKAAGLLKGKSDVVLFANWETYANKKDINSKVERAKGVSTGNRVIYTRRTAAYDAKNRHELPEQMKLDAKPFFEAILKFQTMTPSDLKAAITTAIPKMTESMRGDAISALGRADTEQKLAQLLGWIRENTPATAG